jgi:hypothetical protein
MCGWYRRCSDKQRITELFALSADLEELYFGAEDDVAPGSPPVEKLMRYRPARRVSARELFAKVFSLFPIQTRGQGVCVRPKRNAGETR